MYYDEDRLKTPLLRVERDGKQTFEEVSWEKAFDFIAEKMLKIKAEHGPECTALFTHGSGGTYFGNMLKAFGSNNIAALLMLSAAGRVRWFYCYFRRRS
jgi:thiosulfate reductase/polysulfide reductase chain A